MRVRGKGLDRRGVDQGVAAGDLGHGGAGQDPLHGQLELLARQRPRDRRHRDDVGELIGYQRPEARGHIQEITDYLDSEQPLFPNPIIIALPSTAAGGKLSRIVPFLREGAGVVTTRAHVRTIVTEWGVAELHGRSICERARALITIAHPDFRDELQQAASRCNYG